MPYTDIRVAKRAYYRLSKNSPQSSPGWSNGFRVSSNSDSEETGFFWLNQSDLSAFNATASDITITGASIYFPTSVPVWMVLSGTLGTTALTASNYSNASYPFTLHTTQGITLPGGNDLSPYRSISAGVLSDLLSGSYGIAVKANTVSDNYYNAGSNTISLRIEYNYKSSTVTPDSDTVECGGSISVTLTKTGTTDAPDASYTHTVKCTLGEQTLTAELAAGITTHTFAVPIEWCSEIKNSTTAEGAIICETFNGSKSFGETRAALTFAVPANIVPVAGTIRHSVDNGLNVPISNSSLTARLSGQAGVYGSTIVAYQLACEGYTSVNSRLVVESVPLVHTQDGYRSVTITATVTDSRGRTATTTKNVTVYEWDVPFFSALSVKRCDETGQLTDAGQYVLVDGTYDCYSVNNRNSVQSCTIKVIDTATGAETSGGTLDNGVPKKLGVNIEGMPAFETRKEYAIQLTLTDAVTSTTYESTVYATIYAIQFKYGGTGVAFGQAATEDETVRINPAWRLMIGDDLDVAEILADLMSRVDALDGGNS